jgi:predicted RNase H-like nuclease
LQATSDEQCCSINHTVTGKKISQQAWGIVQKIKAVDDVITPECQSWTYEVNPEVCFCALAERPMQYSKKNTHGRSERVDLLRNVFPGIEAHLSNRPSGVAKDDLLDAAVAAWTALRIHSGEAQHVCKPERDPRGLSVTIWY